jgi:hypothetical protein
MMPEDLSPERRAAAFRKRAADIRATVTNFTTAEAREGLLKIAADWDHLAETAEREAKRSQP